MIDSIKNNFFLYLLFLTPFMLIPGIAVIELSVLFLTLFFFYKNRDIDYFKDFKFLFLILFSFYVAVNAFFQIDDNLRFSSYVFFRFCLLSLSIYFILDFYKDTSDKDKKNILILILGLSTLIFIDSYLQFLSGKNIFGIEIIEATITSIFGFEQILGSFLIKLLPFILFLFFYSNIKINKYFLFLIFFLGFYFSVIFIAGARTPFFLMLIFILLVITLIKELRNIFYLSSFFLIIFILVVHTFEFGKFKPGNKIFIKTFNQITNNSFLNKTEQVLEEKKDTKKKELKKEIKIFSSNHEGHYILSYELFKKDPVWGIGPKGFRHYCRSVDYNPPKGVCSTHPHNFLIQIILETGLVGLIFYLFGLVFVIFKLLKVYNINNPVVKKNCFLIISVGLIVNFFPFVPNGNFFNNWISITNYFYIGFYMFSYKQVFNS